MADKIMFWIDTEFIYFGLAKYIQKNYDCECFAVIDVNQNAHKFFNEQKMVKFKKSWFYLDNVEMDKNVDLDYLKKFEEKYKISLWHIAFSERSFYKYNPYHKFNRNQILSILEKECKFYERILDEVKPDFLIIKTTDWQQNHLFYELCKSKHIKVLMTIPTRLGTRYAISENINMLDKLNYRLENKNRTLNELLEYFHGNNTYDFSKKFLDESQNINWHKIKSMIKFFLASKKSNNLERYSNYNASRFKIFCNQSSLALKKIWRKKFLDKNCVKIVKTDESFIYFPLHIEPERSLSIDAPYYTNQIEIITNIAKSIPINFKVYVKEHPAMSALHWRSISFYKEILELPNVELIHPSVKPKKIYENCSMVITITGTSGLEAAFYEKPSIILGDTIFNDIPSMVRLKNIEELSQVIRLTLGKKVDPLILNDFINYIDKVSFNVDSNAFRTQFSNKYYFGGMLTDPKITQEQIKSFIETNEERFKEFAMQHIKKIKVIKENKDIREV